MGETFFKILKNSRHILELPGKLAEFNGTAEHNLENSYTGREPSSCHLSVGLPCVVLLFFSAVFFSFIYWTHQKSGFLKNSRSKYITGIGIQDMGFF